LPPFHFSPFHHHEEKKEKKNGGKRGKPSSSPILYPLAEKEEGRKNKVRSHKS